MHPSFRSSVVALAMLVAPVACTSGPDSTTPPTSSTQESARNEPESEPEPEPESEPESETGPESEPHSADNTPSSDQGTATRGRAEVLGPLGATVTEFDTGGGRVQVGAADVPSLVGPSFPLPPDLVVQLSSETGSSAGFSGVSQLELDALRDFFEGGLTTGGYEWSLIREVAGVLAVYTFDGPDGTGEIALSSAPGGGRSVLVSYEG